MPAAPRRRGRRPGDRGARTLPSIVTATSTRDKHTRPGQRVESPTIDAAALHRDAIVVDAHDDLPVLLTLWHRSLGPLGDPDPLAGHWLRELRVGGVDVQVLPVYVGPGAAEAALRQTLVALEELHREAAKAPAELAVCTTSAELDAALAAGKVALVLALEGAAALGTDLALLAVLHRLGVRMLSFTHLGRTALADGSGEDDAGSRLPSTGVAALAELERLGIAVDVSHLSLGALEHVLELATRPLVASHSSARAVHDHHRNLHDEHLRAIAAGGGVIGVNAMPAFVDPAQPTLARFVDHVEHVADVAGIDHVGLGPDFIADYYDAVYPQFEEMPLFEGIDVKSRLEGLGAPRDLPNVTAELLGRGFPEADVRKVLGENFLRILRALL